MLTDLDEAGLWEYRSTYKAPPDFDEFWRRTLAEAAEIPLDVRTEVVETRLRTVEVYDVTFAGYAGDPVRAWLRLPRLSGREPATRLPGVVQFHGYGSGRGHALDDLLWASAGYAHLLMDARGQGGGYAGGDTGDPAGSGGPTQPGFLTRGLESPGGLLLPPGLRRRGPGRSGASRVRAGRRGPRRGGRGEPGRRHRAGRRGARARCRGRPLRAGAVPVRHPPRHPDHGCRAVPRDHRLPRHPSHGG